jgi:hypothetical protein
MRLTGIFTEVGLDWEDDSSKVIEAVVTSQRIAIDWIENEEKFHVVATSSDGGLTYKGRFGCPSPEDGWVMEITRFTAKNKAELLIAKWVQEDNGREGCNIFRLWSEK